MVARSVDVLAGIAVSATVYRAVAAALCKFLVAYLTERPAHLVANSRNSSATTDTFSMMLQNLDLSAHVQTGHGAHPASYTMGTWPFPGVKWPGRDVDHTPLSNVEVKERVELYLYSPSGPLWPVLG